MNKPSATTNRHQTSERVAVKDAAKVILTHFDLEQCDSESVSACIRCNAVFLANEAISLARENKRLAETVARYAEQWEDKNV